MKPSSPSATTPTQNTAARFPPNKLHAEPSAAPPPARGSTPGGPGKGGDARPAGARGHDHRVEVREEPRGHVLLGREAVKVREMDGLGEKSVALPHHNR